MELYEFWKMIVLKGYKKIFYRFYNGCFRKIWRIFQVIKDMVIKIYMRWILNLRLNGEGKINIAQWIIIV